MVRLGSAMLRMRNVPRHVLVAVATIEYSIVGDAWTRNAGSVVVGPPLGVGGCLCGCT